MTFTKTFPRKIKKTFSKMFSNIVEKDKLTVDVLRYRLDNALMIIFSI